MEEKNNHPTAENCIQEAKSLLEQGNRVGAVAMLSQAIALNDDAVDAYFLRGAWRTPARYGRQKRSRTGYASSARTRS